MGDLVAPWHMDGPSVSPATTPRYRLLLHTPLTALVIFVATCLIAKENFPFSNFPMYARPSAERGYFFVADGGGNPIPVGTLTGVTASQVGKTYRKKSQELGTGAEGSARQSRADGDRAVGAEIFQMLRQQAFKRGKELPEKLQLHLVEIRFADGEIKETKRVLCAE
jgi:hypothetical protein